MHSKLFSRCLAVFLCLLMFMGTVPLAFADSVSQDGDEDKNPEIVVTLDKEQIELKVGETVKLTATVTKDGEKVNEKVTWDIEGIDTDVVDVSISGKVDAIKVGEVEVTATVGDASASCKVTVVAAEEEVSIKLDKTTLSLALSGKATLTPTVLPAGQTVVWTTSDETVATVSNGTVTAKSKTGTAVITATIVVGDKTEKATCTVTVGTKPTINKTTASIVIDKTETLTIKNLPDGATVAWETGSETIAKISKKDGESITVTAKKTGTTTITAVVSIPGSDDVTLTCKVTVTTTSSNSAKTITHSITSSEVLDFTAKEFNTVCKNLTGNDLDYVIFTIPESKYGVLHYDYDDGSSDHKVSKSDEYYNSGSSKKNYLSKVSFVPKSGYDGTVTINYTGYDTDGTKFTGSIKITVSGDDTVTYSTAKNTAVTFSATDFNNFSKSETGNNLEYVTFTSTPASSRGTLYYDYSSSSNNNTSVSKNTKYYRNDTPSLSKITFVPNSSYTGKVEIDFTGRDVNNKTISGTVVITVGNSGTTVSYSAKAGNAITFSASDFNNICKEETGSNLDYVTFTLPSASNGTLYYDYSSSKNTGKTVSKNTEYYRNDTPSLSKVTFEPASNSVKSVTINYSGRSVDKDNFTGKIVLTFTGTGSSSGNASAINYSTTGGAVQFRSSDFITACGNRGAGTLSSVKFTLPSTTQGILYTGYSSASSFDGVVAASTSFNSGSGTNSISNVYFVPAEGYSGTVAISYVGTDSNDDTFTGTVSIVVSQDGFTDMGNHSWAKKEVDYLYKRGVVAGTSKTTYNPGGNITRGDFVLMLYREYKFSATATDNFSDVAPDSYYADAIAAAKALGIAQGSNNRFNPTDSLTREDAMVLLDRTLDVMGVDSPAANAANLDKFQDKGSISSYARDSVSSLVEAGAIQGDNNNKFNPKNALTRAEMAVVLYRVVQK